MIFCFHQQDQGSTPHIGKLFFFLIPMYKIIVSNEFEFEDYNHNFRDSIESVVQDKATPLDVALTFVENINRASQ